MAGHSSLGVLGLAFKPTLPRALPSTPCGPPPASFQSPQLGCRPFYLCCTWETWQLAQLAVASRVCVLDAQLCPTLCDPMDYSPPDSSVHGDSPGKNPFLRQGRVRMMMKVLAGCDEAWQGLHCCPPASPLSPPLSLHVVCSSDLA